MNVTEPRLLQGVVPAGQGDNESPSGVKQRAVPAEAALAELRKRVTERIIEARTMIWGAKCAGADPKRYRREVVGLVKLWKRAKRTLAARDAGGNRSITRENSD